MYKDDDTENEAIATAATYSSTIDKFCPIILTECRKDCACLQEGSVVKLNYSSGTGIVTKWRSRSPYCTHPFIAGNIGIT